MLFSSFSIKCRRNGWEQRQTGPGRDTLIRNSGNHYKTVEIERTTWTTTKPSRRKSMSSSLIPKLEISVKYYRGKEVKLRVVRSKKTVLQSLLLCGLLQVWMHPACSRKNTLYTTRWSRSCEVLLHHSSQVRPLLSPFLPPQQHIYVRVLLLRQF